ncbi:TPA: hypothetical protein ACGW3G_000910 [Stenotrophomonas maltophilia]
MESLALYEFDDDLRGETPTPKVRMVYVSFALLVAYNGQPQQQPTARLTPSKGNPNALTLTQSLIAIR